MAKFNVLKHELVPEHHLLSPEEEDKVLKELGISKELLPKISRSDPAVLALEEINGPIEEGRVIKIIRKSPTTGYAVYYRVVTSEVFR
ncbi:DNA-directed RNA polymerase subunit H [Thermogymnomonas acidicola]|uniref:DNA-directed RNA polymerase subunit Rpo5 n=1 Tax=Thermogymnomonas acidicola TaxID=399579 RepID=A0AA37BRT2_9ARCH|nr:DNA-directed RNA polymerase subunit H [Thermogymnomonas acidicola]GGM72202.1 DNA-directed RNA polymerase subunit H [Thermogymnomonas acidicola]